MMTIMPQGALTPASATGSARPPPPHFAGRRTELALLNQGLDRLLRTGDPSGGIVLVIGLPGAGKTQLARKFAEEAARRQEGVVGCTVGTSVLESPVDLLLDMAERLDATGAARKAAEIDTGRTGGGVGVTRFFRRSHTKEHVRHAPSTETLLRNSARAGMWKGCAALVLVIDELQTVTPEGMKALRVLHEGNHGCPIYLLGVGLQHTPFVLANPGGRDAISRPNEPIRLGRLSDAEAVEAIARGLANQGHDVPQESAMALAAASQGFPQHVHGYLAGALSAIAEHGHLADDAALQSALVAGHEHRDAYYDLTADKMAPDRGVIHPVVQRMRDRNATVLTRKDAAAAVSESGLDGDAVVRQAIEHGVLELDRGEVSFGIPSFHAHMRKSLDRAIRHERRRRGEER